MALVYNKLLKLCSAIICERTAEICTVPDAEWSWSWVRLHFSDPDSKTDLNFRKKNGIGSVMV